MSDSQIAMCHDHHPEPPIPCDENNMPLDACCSELLTHYADHCPSYQAPGTPYLRRCYLSGDPMLDLTIRNGGQVLLLSAERKYPHGRLFDRDGDRLDATAREIGIRCPVISIQPTGYIALDVRDEPLEKVRALFGESK